MKHFVILLALVIPTLAIARLGETRAELDKRYGKALDDDAKRGLHYAKNGIAVTIGLLKGKAGCIYYSKEGVSDFSEAEIIELLKANAGPDPWAEDKPHDGLRLWGASDRHAECPAKARFLLVTLNAYTIAAEEKRKAEEEAKAKRKLDGF